MLTIRGRSQRTVDAYHIDLRTFLRYVKCVKLLHVSPSVDPDAFDTLAINDVSLDVISALTLADVHNFLAYTMTERSNNAKTRSRKVSAIRALFHHLTVRTHQLHTNPVEHLEVPTQKKSVPKYLTLEESLELLVHIDPVSPTYARDFCILTLFLNCGMRLSELVSINLQDIREDTVKLLGKGNKERIVYLNDACKQALQGYLQVRKPTQNVKYKDALFLSSRGTRLSGRRVEQIVEACLRDAGLSGRGYSPHKLRHTAATLMYQHGNVDVRVLQEILGHVSLSTTEIYTHISDRQMEKAANASPLANVKPQKKRSLPE